MTLLLSEDLGEAMPGIATDEIVVKYAEREGGNMPAHNAIAASGLKNVSLIH
jgi:hypothetical protein